MLVEISLKKVRHEKCDPLNHNYLFITILLKKMRREKCDPFVETGVVQLTDQTFTIIYFLNTSTIQYYSKYYSKYYLKFCSKKYDAESVTLWVQLTDQTFTVIY